jgi:hypothetical protein
LPALKDTAQADLASFKFFRDSYTYSSCLTAGITQAVRRCRLFVLKVYRGTFDVFSSWLID